MTEFADPRTLRLERLESRTLLAGGGLDFAGGRLDFFETQRDFDSGQFDSGQSRTHQKGDSFRADGIGTDVRHHSRSDRRDGRSAHSRGRTERPLAAREGQSRVQSHGGSNTRGDGIEAPGIEVSRIEFSGIEAPRIEAPRVDVSLTVVQTFAPVRTTASQSLSQSIADLPTPITPPSDDAVDSAIGVLTAAAENQATAETRLQRSYDAVKTTQVEESAGQLHVEADVQPQSDRVVTPQAVEDSETIENGWIDLAPWKPFDLTPSDAEAAELLPTESGEPESWRLDPSTSASLTQLSQQSFGREVTMVDDAMRGWFVGPGGMIELEPFELPAIRFTVDASRIDVAVESALALHRSTDPVIGAGHPALSDQVLDAIMASVQQVASSEIQPVSDPSGLQIRSAALPTAAAIAATLAVSSRRKHRHPQPALQSTRVN